MRPFVLASVLALLGSGCLADTTSDDTTPSPSPPPPPYACVEAESFRMGEINATIDTNKGAIKIVLYGDRSPITVCNFLRYAEETFYDGTVWHRICAHVIQAGGVDPYTQEQKPGHEPIKNEAPTSQLRNYKYTLGMARNNAPDSATTHFFINVKDNNYLDFDGQYAPGYAVFGNVTAGQSVVDEIARTQTIPDPPATPATSGSCNGRPAPNMETTIRGIKVDA